MPSDEWPNERECSTTNFYIINLVTRHLHLANMWIVPQVESATSYPDNSLSYNHMVPFKAWVYYSTEQVGAPAVHHSSSPEVVADEVS